MRVRLFAILRERAGSDWVDIDLGEQATVADAVRELSNLPGLSGVLEHMSVGMAVNREYATMSTPLGADDELALIPPISGGVDVHVRVTADPLSLEELTSGVIRPGAGAVVTFQGVPRGEVKLDYEAYREMAEQRMASILEDCLELYGLQAAAAEHRVGSVESPEPSVIVAVSAAHRSEAFAAAAEAIDRIKREVPIWKQETGPDGNSHWTDGVPPQTANAPAARQDRARPGKATL